MCGCVQARACMRRWVGVLICAGVGDVYVCHVRKCASAREGVGVRMLGLSCVHVCVWVCVCMGMCGHVCAYVRVHVRVAMVGVDH